MEPQSNQTPEATPSEQPRSPETPAEAVSLEPVEAPAQQETQGGNEAGNQNQGMPLPVVQPPAVVEADGETTEGVTSPVPTVSSGPELADDVDVIEKEWVDKAKQIVDHNREDPYKQNKEVSTLKADYMKKRYGKDIKLTED